MKNYNDAYIIRISFISALGGYLFGFDYLNLKSPNNIGILVEEPVININSKNYEHAKTIPYNKIY